MIFEPIITALKVVDKGLKKANKKLKKSIKNNSRVEKELLKYGNNQRDNLLENDTDDKSTYEKIRAEEVDKEIGKEVVKEEGKKGAKNTARLGITLSRVANKIAQWILELIELIIKIFIAIAGQVGLVILIAVMVVTSTIGVLSKNIGKTDNMDNMSVSTKSGGFNGDYSTLDWDGILEKAEAKQKLGEMTNYELNVVKLMYLCYTYVKENGETDVYPETILGMSLNECGMRFYQSESKGDIFVDHSNIYQGFVPAYPGNGAIGPLQLDSSGAGYGKSGDTVKDLTPQSNSPLGDNFNIDTYIPYSVARTYKATNIEDITGGRDNPQSEGYYMFKAMEKWGIEENEKSIKDIANMWLYTKHWVPYKFSYDGRAFIGGQSIGGSEKWCEMVGDIACAMYKEGNGDIFAFGTSADSINPTSVMSGDFHTTRKLGLNGSSVPTLNDEKLDTCIIKYLINKYGDKMESFESNMQVFRNTATSTGCDRTMASTAFCPAAGRQLVNKYLKKLGVDTTVQVYDTALNNASGAGPFGINYYNSDGTVDEDAIIAMQQLFYDLTSVDNIYKKSLKVPSSITYNKKKYDLNGGTYPNFWGSQYNYNVSISLWGQCTWWSEGRGMLYWYEHYTKGNNWEERGKQLAEYRGILTHYEGNTDYGYRIAHAYGGGNVWSSVEPIVKGGKKIKSDSIASSNDYSYTGHTWYIEAYDSKNDVSYQSHANVKSVCSWDGYLICSSWSFTGSTKYVKNNGQGLGYNGIFKGSGAFGNHKPYQDPVVDYYAYMAERR